MVAEGMPIDLNPPLSLDTTVLQYGGVVALNQTLVENGYFIQMKNNDHSVSLIKLIV